MKNQRSFPFSILMALLVCFFTVAAFADPPNRAADIRYISGQVSIQPGGVNDWVEAAVNRPLTSSDRVWADKDSRVELGLGSAVLRLSSETSLTLSNVGDQNVQLELDQGALNLHVRKLYDGEIYEVDTPNMAFTLTHAGDYRFDVDSNADTTSITIWNGEGDVTGQGDPVHLRSGEQARFSNGTSLEHQIAPAPGFDGFDDWCRVRNDREEKSASARYVSPGVVGYEDLDEYGTWRELPDYGPVWVPTHVEAGWAPYHYGHWVWIEPWGWTWVDDAPWGFAPSHYGRWVFVSGYWGWAPGPVVVNVRPVYAPALVAWVGGSNWGVSVSFGGGPGVGWFPLGFGEPYIPAYHVSRGYFERVNVSNTRITNITYVTNNYYNTTNVTNIKYVNRGVPGAFTAVPRSALERSQPVARVAVRVPEAEIARGQIVTTAQVAPSRVSVMGVNSGARAAMPSARVVSRPVVTHMAPPPRPVAFEARQGALARDPGRPLDVQTEQQLRARNPQPVSQGPRDQGPREQAPRGPQPPATMNAPSSNARQGIGDGPRPDEGRGRYVPRPPQRDVNNGQPSGNTAPDRAAPQGPQRPAGASDNNPRTGGFSQPPRNPNPMPERNPSGPANQPDTMQHNPETPRNVPRPPQGMSPNPGSRPDANPNPRMQERQMPQQPQNQPMPQHSEEHATPPQSNSGNGNPGNFGGRPPQQPAPQEHNAPPPQQQQHQQQQRREEPRPDNHPDNHKEEPHQEHHESSRMQSPRGHGGGRS